MSEIRFKQIAVAFNESEHNTRIYGLTQDGRVFYYVRDSDEIDWQPMGMRVK